MPEQDRISVEDALRAAIALHQQGHLEQAAVAYKEVLKVVPRHPDALHFYGLLWHQLGHTAEGIELIKQGIAIAPGNPGMYSNLGNIYRQAGEQEAAEEAYAKAIELAPDDANALCNLGALYRAKHRVDEARELLEKALAVDPKHVEAHHQLGFLARDQNDREAAVRHYRMALDLYRHREGSGSAIVNMARSLVEAGKPDEAEQALQELLVRDPENALAKHSLAAVTGKDIPSKAGQQYVKELFDSFAPSFDEVLEGLRYRAPKLLLDKLLAVAPDMPSGLEVLDAGCGTGLMGKLIEPYAARLTGVDLSLVMLAKAEATGVYDELVEGELVEFMCETNARYDLIVSADVLIYFGELDEFFAAASRVLKPGGMLCFSLEKTEASVDGKGYVLGQSGRYAHQRAYVSGLLAAAGFEDVQDDDVVLRLEFGQPVAGLVWFARASS